MIKTADFVYDNNTLAGSTQVGDGNLTQVIAHPGGSRPGPRHRRATTTGAIAWWPPRPALNPAKAPASIGPSSTRRTTISTKRPQVQSYDGDGVTSRSPAACPTPRRPACCVRRRSPVTTTRAGSTRRKTYSVDPTTGTVSTNALTTQRLVQPSRPSSKQSNPGGRRSGQESAIYDGAGRETISYVTDGGGDTTWTDAGNVTGDNVLSQVETTYDKDGNVILVTDRERNHDETTTGALGNPTTAPKARVSYTATYYDLANRLTATVDVGTNGGTA